MAPRPTLKKVIFPTQNYTQNTQKTDRQTDRQEKLRRIRSPAPRSAKKHLWCAAGHVMLLKGFAWLYVCVCVCV